MQNWGPATVCQFTFIVIPEIRAPVETWKFVSEARVVYELSPKHPMLNRYMKNGQDLGYSGSPTYLLETSNNSEQTHSIPRSLGF